MKAICITNRNKETPSKNGRNAILTIGKVYDVKDNHNFLGGEYGVTADTGHPINVPKYYFKLVSEMREELIDKILE
jgi:hypothetical protein